MKLWPFSKKAETEARPNVLSFVLLANPAMPDPHLIAKVASDLDPTSPVKVSETSGTESVIFTCDGSRVIAGMVPVPIPDDEVQRCLICSPTWKEGASPSHAAHVILGVTSPSAPESISVASRVAAAILKLGNGVGWYVGGAAMVHDPEAAVELVEAASGDWSPMTLLWVNVVVSDDGSGASSLSTLGMEMFGHREFEIVAFRSDPGEIREWIRDISLYVLENGPVLLHGQTTGRTADERLRIEVGPSKLGKDGSVIRILVP